MTRFHRTLLPLVVVALVAACDDDDDPAGPDRGAIVGGYQASEFRIDFGATERDLLEEGGYIHLELHANGAMEATVFAPEADEGNEDLLVDVTGTWELDDDVVQLDHDEDFFLRDIDFVFDEDDFTLQGSCCSDPQIFVTLESLPVPASS